jgi:hypothetical protein
MTTVAPRTPTLLLSFLLLAACQPDRPETTAVPEPAAAPTAQAPTVDASAMDAPAVNAPAVDAAAMDAPAADAPHAGTTQSGSPLSMRGVGPAHFGSDEQAVRTAWGRPLKSTAPAPGASCHFLLPEASQGAHRGVAFMFEDGKFSRYDVDTPEQVAPGGLRVGDRLADALAKFPGRAQATPDKYIQGAQNASIEEPGQPGVRLVFQGDAGGRIIAWRIGVMPQVAYVEGCG